MKHTYTAQISIVLRYLKRGWVLTQLQCAKWERPVLRLGAIVHVLRREGYKIQDISDERYSKYKLVTSRKKN